MVGTVVRDITISANVEEDFSGWALFVVQQNSCIREMKRRIGKEALNALIFPHIEKRKNATFLRQPK